MSMSTATTVTYWAAFIIAVVTVLLYLLALLLTSHADRAERELIYWKAYAAFTAAWFIGIHLAGWF